MSKVSDAQYIVDYDKSNHYTVSTLLSMFSAEELRRKVQVINAVLPSSQPLSDNVDVIDWKSKYFKLLTRHNALTYTNVDLEKKIQRLESRLMEKNLKTFLRNLLGI